jgi:hypothetical protein
VKGGIASPAYATMGVMRRLILLVCALGLSLAANKPQLDAVHTVYLLPMGGSLDQYLATRLTQLGTFQVVTDPQKADAIFTDKIGEGFEQKMQELYPPPETKTDDEKDADKDKDPYGKPGQRFGSFSRGHGTVFLVDRQSRNVVWSIYWPIKSSRPDDVNRRADQIAEKLRKDIKGK